MACYRTGQPINSQQCSAVGVDSSRRHLHNLASSLGELAQPVRATES
jgi:hypothetical protein